MGKMTWPLILAMLAFLPAEGRGQSSGATERVTRDAVAAEVRLLRQAVERLAAVSVRSHVLVSRLAVQQQRVARAQDAVDRVAQAMDAADRTQERTRGALAKLNGVLANVIEEPRRSELEREVETLRADLVDNDRNVARLRARRSQAEQSLRSEQQIYGELEASLNGLDRELQRPSS
jgi:chromosome segregation ATPase